MSYQGYEVTTGDVLRRVQGLCRHLTDKGLFTDTSPVTLETAESYLTDAYYFIAGELAKNGYDTAVASTQTQVLALLTQVQALDAVCQIEFSMPVSDTGEPNDRFKGMAARRDRLINDYFRSDTLEQLGAVRVRNKSQYLELTGRNSQRKQTVYQDTSIVAGRFPRGYGQRRDIPARSGTDTYVKE